ncbi:hypothetical protein [Streptomyces sp. NPDC057702]|uniref:hypothetical protein n=1 Tax=unclassified Streptomyces TaxID=2593676 RepID=UPI0036C50A96
MAFMSRWYQTPLTPRAERPAPAARTSREQPAPGCRSATCHSGTRRAPRAPEP